MYHQLKRLAADERAKFLNAELRKEEFQILEYLADHLQTDESEIREDMAKHGWYYIIELNRFVKVEAEQASL
ncbi:hypothetical protein [Paenibacillus hamazuiensis]|uniref:hypothetical protein n=1 Tax=Paenibacillus hamazuiensis TaxID=2936508 RepID=UPI00200E5313|nr:hypothetical protein [Paenibacillus hamazuiensis]